MTGEQWKIFHITFHIFHFPFKERAGGPFLHSIGSHFSLTGELFKVRFSSQAVRFERFPISRILFTTD